MKTKSAHAIRWAGIPALLASVLFISTIAMAMAAEKGMGGFGAAGVQANIVQVNRIQDDGEQRPGSARGAGPGTGTGGGQGMGSFIGGHSVEGTVTSATASELTIRTELGDFFKVQFNQNTHFMKDHQPVKSSDIKVGEAIMVGGNIDAQAKTVGAAFVAALDAEQVKQIREAHASFGKTWLAGKVTAIDETRISIAALNGKPASILVDENTSFKKHKESITLADVKVGDAVNAKGALKGGIFLATDFQLMEPRGERGPRDTKDGDGAPRR